MSSKLLFALFCFLTVVSCKNTKTKWPKPDRTDPSQSPLLKQEILNLMGLPRRPKLTISSRMRQLMSAPRYMMNLYNSISQNQSYKEGFCCNNTIADSRALGADTIMSYLHPVHGKGPKISHHHAKYQFKIVTPEDEKITATEFRLYKHATSAGNKTSGWNETWANNSYVVRLYQVIYPAQVLDLIESRVLRSWDSGWQEFDISKAGKTWSESPSNNYGLELSVENFLNHEISPHKAGFVGFKGPREYHPFIVSFFQRDSDAPYSRRFYPSFMKPKVTRSSRVTRSVGRVPRRDQGEVSSKKGICQRRVLYVNFKKLQWQDWVIAPGGYSAFYCYGECSFPLNSNMNATNHAIVQTLVHLMNPKTVPKPCCAPTKLSSISVLYFNDDNDVVLKKYPNMVVTSCGCH